MLEKFMKLFNLWGNSASEPVLMTAVDEELKSAETAETGQSHEVPVDFMKPVQAPSSFLCTRGKEDNEWFLLNRDASSFYMRAVVSFESGTVFHSDFDTKFVYSNEIEGRVRVAIYLDESSTGQRTNPAVVIMSSSDRRSWRVLEVTCDACRYRRRRSSYTEGLESHTAAVPHESAASPCSYTHQYLDQVQADFRDIVDVIPSSRELVRIAHTSMLIKSGTFTQIRVEVPPMGVKWCPLAVDTSAKRGVLQEGNSRGPSSISYRTRIPIWSDKFKALALEFKNRHIQPSRRNYHLLFEPSQTPACYFYRTAKSEYVLEILPESRLSIMQAFCIALTTSLWS